MEFNATILVSTISFILFTLIMNKILYAPMSEIVEKRKAYLDQNASNTEQNNNEAQTMIEDKERQINEAKSKSKHEITTEMEAAKTLKAATLAQKKAQTLKQVEARKVELEQERANLQGEIDSCANSLSDTLLAKLTGGAG